MTPPLPVLLAERYAPPAWWPTPPPPAPAPLDARWETCAGCRRWQLADMPCPHCTRTRPKVPLSGEIEPCWTCGRYCPVELPCPYCTPWDRHA